ncbi:MAG: hypothetical protein HLUCCA12_10345 [Rhodobacteraceae bacterium HLUCCA12]|nr:MAG: hypothetical protein HLUCCA12_10345 [Rhodobacteraceae bacterium HLUCCA12]
MASFHFALFIPAAISLLLVGAADAADVTDVSITPEGDGRFSFAVTVESDDTGWDRYADRWEILDPQGSVLGTRELHHPHVDEQPFTRSLSDVEIPADIESVTIRAHDSVDGFSGESLSVDLPGR